MALAFVDLPFCKPSRWKVDGFVSLNVIIMFRSSSRAISAISKSRGLLLLEFGQKDIADPI